MSATVLAALNPQDGASPEAFDHCGSGQSATLTQFSPSTNKTTMAVFKFLAPVDEAERADAFDHLMAILFKATGGLFLTETGVPRFEAKRDFFEAWLLETLLPYRNAGNVEEAAAGGEFRYLAKQGWCALIDELRKRGRSRDVLQRPTLHLDAAIETEDGDAHSWHDLLGLDCHEASFCSIGSKPSLDTTVLQQKLQQCRIEITKKLGETSFHVLSIICGLFPDRLSLGDVTKGIAEARAVSLQTARKLHRVLTRTLASLSGDPVVRELFEIISSAGDPIRLSTGTWDALSQGFSPN